MKLNITGGEIILTGIIKKYPVLILISAVITIMNFLLLLMAVSNLLVVKTITSFSLTGLYLILIKFNIDNLFSLYRSYLSIYFNTIGISKIFWRVYVIEIITAREILELKKAIQEHNLKDSIVVESTYTVSNSERIADYLPNFEQYDLRILAKDKNSFLILRMVL